MESYREIIEKAKKLEAVVNSFGSDIHLQRAIELVGCEEMKLIAGCLNRQVSMPSRAYTSFLRYPFKNLGFMRFPEPVFAGIYQNILTTAVFRAC